MTGRKAWPLAVCLMILGMSLAAQTTSPPNPPSPDLTALQNQLNALNLQLQTVTAQNQILAAKVGAPAVTPVQPLAGNITQTDDKAFPEASALAYNAMRADAKRIYDRIETAIASPVHKDKNFTLVIYDQATLTGVQQYLAFKPQLALQRESLCFAATAARIEKLSGTRRGFTPAEAEAGTNLVSSVATLLAMFRTDVERRSTDVTIDDPALVQEVANLYKSKRSLPNEGVHYNTRLFVPGQYFMPDEVDQSELNKLFKLTAGEVFNEEAGGCKIDAPAGFYARMAELAVIRDLANEVYAQSAALFQKLTDAENKLKDDQAALKLLQAKEKLTDDEKARLKALELDVDEDKDLVRNARVKIEESLESFSERIANAKEKLKEDQSALKQLEAIPNPTENQKKEMEKLRKEIKKDIEALTEARKVFDKNQNDNAIEKKRQQVADLKAALDRYDTLVKALGTPDTAGLTPLAKYASSDRLSQFLLMPNTYLLALKVLKASASNETKKNLFLGTRLYFSGACIASFALIDSATSDVVSSGSFTTVTNYMREKTFKQKFGTEVVQ